MEFDQLLEERYSVRKFSDQKVEKEKIDKILEAARIAPTAVNYQPQRILVVEDPDNLAKLKECTRYHFHAPLAMILCYDKTVSWKDMHNRECGEVDVSIVATYMMLKLFDLGLGSTYVGSFDYKELIKQFNIPENYVPVMILPIGYPREIVYLDQCMIRENQSMRLCLMRNIHRGNNNGVINKTIRRTYFTK